MLPKEILINVNVCCVALAVKGALDKFNLHHPLNFFLKS